MTDENVESLFNAAYQARVREAREARKWTAEQMATALGIPADRYRKYETRSPLPAYLIERFCLIAGVDLHWLLTGRASSPSAKFPPGING